MITPEITGFPNDCEVITMVPCNEWAGHSPIFEDTEPVTVRKWMNYRYTLTVNNITGKGISKIKAYRAFSRKSKKAFKKLSGLK